MMRSLVRLVLSGSLGLAIVLVTAGCGGREAFVGTANEKIALAEDATRDSASAVPTFGTNLVKNSGFERPTGSDGTTQVLPDQWNRTAGFPSVVLYGSPGFPSLVSPGPPTRGSNLLTGGDGGTASVTQMIDVSWAATVIKAKQAKCICSAWVGGYGSQNDRADLYLTTYSAAGRQITDKQVVTGPLAGERGNETRLMRRTWSGILPKGARTLMLQIVFTRFDGSYNDGYMDKLSLVLKNVSPAVGTPAPGESQE